MASNDVVIRQIATYETKSFINVEDTNTGQLQLYGNCLTSPTYLMVKENEWSIIVFDDKEWASEGLDERTGYYDEVYQFSKKGLVQIIGTKDA